MTPYRDLERRRMDSSLRIRTATRGEAELLLEIQKASSVAGFGHVFPADKYPFPSEAVLDRWQKAIDDPADVVVLAELATAAVGFAAMRSEWLDAVYVSPTCWSMGVGVRLHDHALTWIRDLGCKRCHLLVLEQRACAPLLRASRLAPERRYASCPVSSVPHRRRIHDRAIAAGRSGRRVVAALRTLRMTPSLQERVTAWCDYSSEPKTPLACERRANTPHDPRPHVTRVY